MRILLSLLLFTLLCTCISTPLSNHGPAPEKAGDGTEITQAVYQDLTPAEFAERIGAENTVLLDVRTPAETAKGKIEGAMEMDYRSSNFADQLRELDPGKTYLVYCAVGGRSGKACGMLNELGADKVYNLSGGYSAWRK
jgi:rhodanese-related sulfurtransferase